MPVSVMDAIARLLDRGRPTVEDVARELSINVRTLQRRLAREGLPFRELLNECCRLQALAELQAGDRTVREVSARLGYSDPAHFVRAFRRWTGQPPTKFGRKRR